MWKLKNSEGREQLCHTLDEVVTVVLNSDTLLKYTLKFIPLYEKAKVSSLKEREEWLDKNNPIGGRPPIPLSNQD